MASAAMMRESVVLRYFAYDGNEISLDNADAWRFVEPMGQQLRDRWQDVAVNCMIGWNECDTGFGNWYRIEIYSEDLSQWPVLRPFNRTATLYVEGKPQHITALPYAVGLTAQQQADVATLREYFCQAGADGIRRQKRWRCSLMIRHISGRTGNGGHVARIAGGGGP